MPKWDQQEIASTGQRCLCGARKYNSLVNVDDNDPKIMLQNEIQQLALFVALQERRKKRKAFNTRKDL